MKCEAKSFAQQFRVSHMHGVSLLEFLIELIVSFVQNQWNIFNIVRLELMSFIGLCVRTIENLRQNRRVICKIRD